MDVRYSVYDALTDQPIIVAATTVRCAERLGLTLGSFLSMASRQRNGKRNDGSTKYRIIREEEKDG